MKYTEDKLEQAIIALLGEQGYPHLPGGSIDRELQTVLLTDDLHEYLHERYKKDKITDNEIDGIIRELRQFPAADLYQSNKAILTRVSNGFDLKCEDRSRKDLHIRLFDETKPANNIHHVVNEFAITSTGKPSRMLPF